MSLFENLPGINPSLNQSGFISAPENGLLSASITTTLNPANFAFASLINVASPNFSVSLLKDGVIVARIDIFPAESKFNITYVNSAGTDIFTSPSLTNTLVNPMQIWYAFLYSNTFVIAISDGVGVSVANTVVCDGLSECNQVETPDTFAGSFFDTQAEFEAGFSGAKSAYGALQVVYNFFNPPMTNPPPSLNICSADIPTTINTPMISNEAWAVIGVLIGVSVLFIILFALSVSKVIQ